MRVRWIGLTLVLALAAGVAGGYAAAAMSRDEPAVAGAAEPVAAHDPMFPLKVSRPFAEDIDYPPLPTVLNFQQHRIGDDPFTWVYDAPRGWTPTVEGLEEIRWRPADEPLVGGFSLRVKLINARQTTDQMVEAKRIAMTTGYEDVRIRQQDIDTLSFTYRDPGTDRLRFDTFRWFTSPGGSTADFEMSVVGRKVDEPGLASLLEAVSSSIHRQPAT